jgi:hypothetical protein
MSVSSVNSSSSLSSLYDSLFGTSSSSSSYSVSDYAMISNGSYRKLMKAYYATEDSSSSSSSSSSTSSDSKVKLLSTKSQAATLNNSLEDLSSKSLYEASGKDEKGNNTYDQEKIASSVKSFVESYNSYINSASELDSTSLLKKATNMVSATSTYSSMLSDIGVTIGENNNLVIDEDKLGSADVSVVSSLFQGSGSYGDRIQTLARDSYKLANSEAYNQSNNSSYTQSGGYSTLGSTNGVLDRYL